MLVRPDRARLRMDRDAHRVPVAQGVDLRLVRYAADERIVEGHAPVVSQPKNFSHVVVRVLRA